MLRLGLSLWYDTKRKKLHNTEQHTEKQKKYYDFSIDPIKTRWVSVRDTGTRLKLDVLNDYKFKATIWLKIS